MTRRRRGRRWLGGLTLALVLGASLLDLSLGVLWVASVVATLWMGRRGRAWPGLLAVAALGLVGGGGHLGWFPPPAPAPYRQDWILGPLTGPGDAVSDPATAPDRHGGPPDDALRAELRRRLAEERAAAETDYVARAADAVGLMRQLGPLRGAHPREVEGLEAATRRLALTLTSEDFHDLERRRARATAYLGAVRDRLARAEDATDLAAVRRLLEPTETASVSLGALAEEHARVEAATAALLRAVGGREPSVRVSWVVGHDEPSVRLVHELRYDVEVAAPLRIAYVEPPIGGRRVRLGVDGGAERDVETPARIAVDPEARRISLVQAWGEPAVTHPVRSPLRRIPFQRLVVRPPAGSLGLTAGIALGPAGPVARVRPALPTPALTRVEAGRYALFHVGGGPGQVAHEAERDTWRPRAPVAVSALAIEVTPAGRLFRNAGMAALRPYLYRPNPGAALAVLGLGALTVALARGSAARTAPVP